MQEVPVICNVRGDKEKQEISFLARESVRSGPRRRSRKKRQTGSDSSTDPRTESGINDTFIMNWVEHSASGLKNGDNPFFWSGSGKQGEEVQTLVLVWRRFSSDEVKETFSLL